MSSLTWLGRGGNCNEFRELLGSIPRQELESALFNERYNQFCSEWCDSSVYELPEGNGKRIPYLGWFWRECSFYERDITVGFLANGYVGIMENNKWGHPERTLTNEEFDTLMSHLDNAIKASLSGSNRRENVLARLAQLHDWMQTLKL